MDAIPDLIPLPRSFFERPTLTVARSLLGAYLVRSDRPVQLVTRIVETEAYVGEEDRACHAASGKTRRNEVLYGPPGHAYVYFTYGMHHCLNVVTEKDGFPAAVLFRAAEPLNELARLRRRRAGRKDRELLGGPGRLCAGLLVDRAHNGVDLTDPGSPLFLCRGRRVAAGRIETSPRIGISKRAGEARGYPWRFFDSRSSFVSPGRVTVEVCDPPAGTRGKRNTSP